jgi:hypothetical protein
MILGIPTAHLIYAISLTIILAAGGALFLTLLDNPFEECGYEFPQ